MLAMQSTDMPKRCSPGWKNEGMEEGLRQLLDDRGKDGKKDKVLFDVTFAAKRVRDTARMRSAL